MGFALPRNYNTMTAQKFSCVPSSRVKLAKLKNLTWCAHNCALCAPLCRAKLIGSFGARELPFSRDQEHITQSKTSTRTYAWISSTFFATKKRSFENFVRLILCWKKMHRVFWKKGLRRSLTRNKRAAAIR